MKQLEQYLLENYEKGIIDYSLRVSINSYGNVSFYIHPTNKNGETLDFSVIQNMLVKNRDIKYKPLTEQEMKESMQFRNRAREL